MSSQTEIEVRGVQMTFGRRQSEQTVLRDIDLRVAAGEFVALLGPSGCGKTTLLKIIAGLLDPTRGAVTIGGRPAPEALSRREIGLVFQQPILLPWKDVLANAAFLGEIATERRERRKLHSHTRQMLALVDLADAADKLPRELSGGMAQRVAIARALVLNPRILLMDEPFGALDAITRDQMNVSLLEIWSKTAKTIVFVTHSISEAIFLSDRIVVMEARGRTREVLDIDLPRPRTDETPDDARFGKYERHLRALLIPRDRTKEAA